MSRETVFDLTALEDLRSILVVRLFALGDIVLTLPLVRLLRDAFPGAWIGYLVRERYAGALCGDTGIDEVIGLPDSAAGQLSTLRYLRKKKADAAVDLLSNPRSAVLTRFSGAGVRIGMDTGRRNGFYDAVLPRAIIRDGKRVRCYTLDVNLEVAGMLGIPRGESTGGTGEGDVPYGFPAASCAGKGIEEFVKDIRGRGKGLAGIVPGTTYPSKGWPEERFTELAGRISDELGLTPVIMWGPGERDLAERIASAVPGAVVAPPTGIAESGALIGALDVLAGVDSGPKHIAVMMGVPTVTLFGPTDPGFWDPMNGIHRVVWKGLECAAGCREKDCAHRSCMDSITVPEVFDEIAVALERGRS